MIHSSNNIASTNSALSQSDDIEDDEAELIRDFVDTCLNPLELTSKCQEAIDWLHQHGRFNKKTNAVISFLVKNVLHISPSAVERVSNLTDCRSLQPGECQVSLYTPKCRSKRNKEGMLEIVKSSTAVIVCYGAASIQSISSLHRNGLNFGGAPSSINGVRIQRGRNLVKGINARIGELLNSRELVIGNINALLTHRDLEHGLVMIADLMSETQRQEASEGPSRSENGAAEEITLTQLRSTKRSPSRGKKKNVLSKVCSLEELVQQCLTLYTRYYDEESDQLDDVNAQICVVLKQIRNQFPELAHMFEVEPHQEEDTHSKDFEHLRISDVP